MEALWNANVQTLVSTPWSNLKGKRRKNTLLPIGLSGGDVSEAIISCVRKSRVCVREIATWWHARELPLVF